MPIPTTPSATSIPPADTGAVFNAWEHPTTGEPYEIDGYELVRRVGQPTAPITPADVLVLPDGTMLVADAGLGRLVAFDAAGTFLPEWGEVDHSPDGHLPVRLASDRDGWVYVLYSSGRVERVDARGMPDDWGIDWGDGPNVVPSTISSFSGLAVDRQGNVFLGPMNIGSTVGSAVVQFGADGQPLLAWDLDPDCLYGDMAIDQQDRIYVACSDGVYTLGEGGGPEDDELGKSERFWALGEEFGGEAARPRSVAVEPDGTIVVLYSGGFTVPNPGADAIYHDWHMIRVDQGGTEVGHWSVPPLEDPNDVTPPSISTDARGRIYLPDPVGQMVIVFDTAGMVSARISDQVTGMFTSIDGLAVGPDGDVYVLDAANQQVVRLDAAGAQVDTITLPPTAASMSTDAEESREQQPELVVAEDGSLYLVTPSPRSRLLRISPAGELLGEWHFTHENTRLAIDNEGIAYALDTDRGVVERIDTRSNTHLGKWETVLEYHANDLWIHDETLFLTGNEGEEDDAWWTSAIWKFSLEGNALGRLVSFVGAEAMAEVPVAVMADSSGNVYTGTLRISAADSATPSSDDGQLEIEVMLRVFDQQGNLLHSARLGAPGDASLDLAVSPDGAYLYLTDPVNRQVLVYERT